MSVLQFEAAFSTLRTLQHPATRCACLQTNLQVEELSGQPWFASWAFSCLAAKGGGKFCGQAQVF